jgi:prepilin-type N-terminal cleavage/methylation domain-containing protein/prepilin-type processing-associated H-X9-DG protein
MQSRRTIHARAFTLVELLVVIGIIAVLIGVLLPVLSGIAARGRDLQCQSNIRQCVTLFLAYAAENKGQLPFGYYFERTTAADEGWAPGPADADGTLPVIHLWSVISRMSSKSYSGSDQYVAHATYLPEAARDSAPFLRCPEAMQVRPHVCSYVGSIVAFVTPWTETFMGGRRNGTPWTRLIERQTKTTQCASYTALMWDTTVTPGSETRVGHYLGGDIDQQRIWSGASAPQQRYLMPNDPYARLGPGTYGQNKPVVLGLTSAPWYNIDPAAGRGPDGLGAPPYQGNLRFRHARDTRCNVGFADGHVGQFTGKFKRDGAPISHDAIRKSFMVKWPSGNGLAPNPNLPH